MLINRVDSINRLIESGNSYADVIELLKGEPDQADVYREAFTHAIGILELMPSQDATTANLEIMGLFDDLGRCGRCQKTIGTLSFIYDSQIEYCPFCGAKLNNTK